jgi:parvulin-like peptidyl-prolyl isomerase
MKILKILTAICVFSVLSAVSSGAGVVDRIVAVVNDDVITLSELNRDLESYMERVGKSFKGADREKFVEQVRLAILNDLINGKLVIQKAKKRGIVVTDADVDDVIEDTLNRRKMSMEEMKMAIAGDGHTFEEYREEARCHLIKMRLIGREIRSKIIVSQKEIGDYYRQHRNDYEGKEAVRIRQILIIIPKGCDIETKQKLEENAEEILKKLKSGESFSMLAAKFSQGPAAKAGGDLGYVEKGLMLPEVDRVAFKLKTGETSEVIESPTGFHIIKIIDKMGKGIKPFDAVREEIMREIGNKKIEKKFQEWLKKEREKSLIEIRL